MAVLCQIYLKEHVHISFDPSLCTQSACAALNSLQSGERISVHWFWSGLWNHLYESVLSTTGCLVHMILKFRFTMYRSGSVQFI